MSPREALYKHRTYTCLNDSQHDYLRRASSAQSTTASIYLRRLIEGEMSGELPSPYRAIAEALGVVLDELRLTQELVQVLRLELADSEQAADARRPSRQIESIAGLELDNFKERRKRTRELGRKA